MAAMLETLHDTLSARLAAERTARDNGGETDALAIVDVALAEAGMTQSARIGAAARGLLDSSCSLRSAGAQAREMLGIPDDGRSTSFAVWQDSRASTGTVVATFESEAARRVAHGCFAAAGAPPSSCLGLALPEEVSIRLCAARDRPRLAPHYLRTACDHMAAHVLSLVSGLEGSSLAHGTACWAGSFPPSRLQNALAWLTAPGPGPFASSVSVVLPREDAR